MGVLKGPAGCFMGGQKLPLDDQFDLIPAFRGERREPLDGQGVEHVPGEPIGPRGLLLQMLYLVHVARSRNDNLKRIASFRTRCSVG